MYVGSSPHIHVRQEGNVLSLVPGGSRYILHSFHSFRDCSSSTLMLYTLHLLNALRVTLHCNTSTNVNVYDSVKTELVSLLIK